MTETTQNPSVAVAPTGFAAGVSIVYSTHRPDPRFRWFADSLAAQAEGDDFEVIVVDGLHSPVREAQLRAAVAGRFSLRTVSPKPSPYGGPYRLTKTNFYALASARNTGVVYASRPYVAFVDDCSVLMPGWWEEVQSAARHGYVVAGAYNVHREMVVENGELIHSRIDRSGRSGLGLDSRWDIGNDQALVRCHGGQLYGGNFAVPRDVLLAVNGTDELCDVMDGEDYHLGIRLEWSGQRIFFSRRMLLIKAEERHDPGGTVVVRLDKLLNRSLYMRKLHEFGVPGRREGAGDWHSTQLALDILYGTRAVRSLGNCYDLRDLDESNLLDTVERFPTRHWVDDQPLEEM